MWIVFLTFAAVGWILASVSSWFLMNDTWNLYSFAWIPVAIILGPVILVVVLSYKAATDDWWYALLAVWAGGWIASGLVVLRDFGNAQPWVGSTSLQWIFKIDLVGSPLLFVVVFLVAVISSGGSGGGSGSTYSSGAPESRTAGARLSVRR